MFYPFIKFRYIYSNVSICSDGVIDSDYNVIGFLFHEVSVKIRLFVIYSYPKNIL